MRAITFNEHSGIGPLVDDIFDADDAPTAVFCGSDGIGVNVVSELARRALRVPEHVSVVGYLDYACATQVVPALTTLRVPVKAM